MLETNSDRSANTSGGRQSTDVLGGGTGFKGFSRTGREDTTDEILRPTVDPATRVKYGAMIGAVVVLLGLVGYMAFSRSGLKFGPPPEEQKAFAPTAPQGE